MGVKVSLVLPSLNVGKYIWECLESVVRQTLREIEILCVDAGSTDGTLETIEYFAQKDSRIRLIQSDRKSYGYQMNLGISVAQGEYIGIVETDDYVLPEMYETLYRAASEQDADVVSSDFCYFVGDGEYRKKTLYRILDNEEKYLRVLDPCADGRPCFSVPIFTWTAVYRRSFLQNNHVRYHESPGAAYQDNGFFFQVYTHARRWYAIPKAFYMLRRDNAASSVFQASNLIRMLDEYRFIKEILERDGVFQEFRHEYAYRYIDSCVWVLDNLAYRDMERFLLGFRDELRDILALGTFRYTDYDEHRLALLFKILHGLEWFAENEIAPRCSFYERLGKSSNVIIYGDGAVGKMFFDEVHVNAPNVNVIAFAVSQKNGHAEAWQGVGIYAIQELEEHRRDCIVVIATKEKFHGEIKEILEELGFEHVVFFPWEQSLGGTYRKQFVKE